MGPPRVAANRGTGPAMTLSQVEWFGSSGPHPLFLASKPILAHGAFAEVGLGAGSRGPDANSFGQGGNFHSYLGSHQRRVP